MTASSFPAAEYQARTHRAQKIMQDADLAALLLTTEADVRYFTGFLTRFWESPTRPWFVVVPSTGNPIAVIPSIGAALMQTTWVEDIRTWRAPDADDDGVSLLANTLMECTPVSTRIGVPSGQGTSLRMPLGDWAQLDALLKGRELVSDGDLMRDLRMVKTTAEIDCIEASCRVADRAFDRVAEIATARTPLRDVFRRFQMLCLEEGADWVPYLAGGAGQGGYRDVISPAGDTLLETGDVLMLDTGLVREGYFCDFDRNFTVGPPKRHVIEAHKRLIEATFSAFDFAKPGVTAGAVFDVMDQIVTGGEGGSDAGRLGHGLGMQLTEPPSLVAGDPTVLRAGMVLTLEPGIDLGDGRIMVHEENIVVTETGARWLSTPQGEEIRELNT